MGNVLFAAVCIMLAVMLVLGLMYSACRAASWADEHMARLTEVKEHESNRLSETVEKAGHDDFEQID